MLQDKDVEKKQMQRGGTMMDGANISFEYVDENLLKGLDDFDVDKIKAKRFTELIPQEQVVLTLSYINSKVNEIESLVQKACSYNEQTFLDAYSGHMGAVMQQLKIFKKKINVQKFEMKKNKKIKSLTAEVDYFKNETIFFKELDKKNIDAMNE